MKKFCLIIFCISLSSLAGAAPAKPVPPPSGFPPGKLPGVLPPTFAGWEIAGGTKTNAEPLVADPADPAVIKEYGFKDLEAATYTRDDRKMTIRAARFADASGAYGAFTFYRDPRMQTEQIGDGGASANNRILFFRYNVLVDVQLDKVTAMSGSDLRELASALPRPAGEAVTLPGLPNYLPRRDAIENSQRYVVGPIALERVHAPLRFALVDFPSGAEVALQDYATSLGSGTLMVIGYPTPQIAAARLKAIETWRSQAAAQPSLTQNSSSELKGIAPFAPARAEVKPDSPASPVTLTGEFQVKRTGPLLVIAAGQISSREAKALLGSVNYEAEVTWHEDAHARPPDNVGLFVLGEILLVVVILFVTLVAGAAFGGFRILAQTFFPERIFHRPDKVEFIRLNLHD